MNFCSIWLFVLLLAGTLGCSSVQYSFPATFDIAGDWTFDEKLSDPAPDLTKIWKSEEQRIITRGAAKPTDSATFVLQDFPILDATSIRIEHDEQSMGIRFDQLPYRDYKWGKQRREGWRISVGWVNNRTLVIVRQRDSVRGSESYKLDEDGEVLEVLVRVDSAGNKISSKRVYLKQ